MVRVCTECSRPTFLAADIQTPGARPGGHVESLAADVKTLYDEARNAIAANAPTSAVLTLRKILMHTAVEQGASAGSSFLHYVEYLHAQGLIPPNAKGWVDHIRDKGNEANHEIVVSSDDEARRLLGLVEMLLRIVYELPASVPPKP